jgi:hypothetical protein
MKHLTGLHFMGRLLLFLIKGLKVTNTITYYGTVVTAVVKSFIVETPGRLIRFTIGQIPPRIFTSVNLGFAL